MFFGFDSFGNIGGMFDLVSIIFPLIFLLVFGIILYTLCQGIKQEHRNNNSPRLTVEAKVVSKRTNHSRHYGSRSHTSHTTTTYFATFEVASGDRLELRIMGTEYGLLVEGDVGSLTFQGTRYLGFQRKINVDID